MQEQCQALNGTDSEGIEGVQAVELPASIKPGNNIRLKGLEAFAAFDRWCTYKMYKLVVEGRPWGGKALDQV